MRRIDLAPALHPFLVKCAAHPNCHALVPPPTPRMLPADGAVAKLAREATQALERLKATTALLPDTDMVTRTLTRREAVQSSQIEGTRTTLHELLEYEATRSTDGLPADATVTERYVQALEHGLATLRAAGSRDALDADLVKAMHAILMQDSPNSADSGQYRLDQAWIGNGRIEDATFVPAPPDRIAEGMDELQGSMLQYQTREDEQWQLPLITQVAIAHAQFETIHPFTDGNGRTGRLLMPLILAAADYPPLYLSGRLLRHRRAYYDALASVQLRADWMPWLKLCYMATTEACDGAIAIAKDLNLLRDGWLSQLSGLRSDATARRLPGYLLGHPVVTVNEVAEALEISFRAANRSIEQLVERQILTEPKKRRNRVFHATGVLDRLARE